MTGARRDLASLPDAVEDAVLAALELDGEARAQAIAAVCAEHASHAEVIRRWIADAERGGTLHAGAPAGGDDEPLPPALGPYRIVRLLGRGGFGSVYLAEQELPLRREVAIKVLNPGMDSREVLGRFAGEREALNRMDHPGIARLLDAGETPNRRPYFVMEYVPGVPITRWCRQRELDLPARLRLFLQVLDAVQHAHQKAVIHRDLSTSNVLVVEHDGRPQPKIIDFGIAKSLAAPLSVALTFRGTLMGTPEFMSPEQAEGSADIDTRTDIYALGVQLYELLTDQLPIPSHLLRNHGIGDVGRLVREFQPALPSQLAAPARAAQLRGDLDWIARKALAKDRADRYASVSELAADLERHLRHEPVSAGPPGTWYRLRKFVRRYRGQVLAGGALALAALAAVLVALWALDKARREEAGKNRAQSAQAALADAGFRLLAHDELLGEALRAEAALQPPWPEQVPAMQQWLQRYGEVLAAAPAAVRAKLAELQPRLQKPDADASERYLQRALLQLQGQLREFTAADGPLQRVRRSLQFARDIGRRSLEQHAAAWQAAVAAIRTSDGVLASAAYRGLQLPPQVGLVPLGMDPRTRLWLFLDLASHPPDAPVPSLDALPPDCGIVFALLPPGEFWMGSYRGEPGLAQNDPDAQDDELPATPVMLEAFLLATTELSNAQWTALSGGEPPGRFTDPRLPVQEVSWRDADALLRRWGMQLPTEAQWEYGCRAGTTTRWSFGDEPAAALVHAGAGALEPLPVAPLPANGFGLAGMHGNVAEWCCDLFTDYRTRPRAIDGLREPAMPALAPGRVVRGGAFDLPLLRTRSASRAARDPNATDADLGLRAARALRL